MKKIKISYSYLFFLIVALLSLISGLYLFFQFSSNDKGSESYWKNGYFTFTVYVKNLNDDQLRSLCQLANYSQYRVSNYYGNDLNTNGYGVSFNCPDPANKGAITSYSVLHNGNDYVQTQAHMGSYTNVYTSELTYSITVYAPTNYSVAIIESYGDFYHGTGYYALTTPGSSSVTISKTQRFSSDGDRFTYERAVVVFPKITTLHLNSVDSTSVRTCYGKTWNFSRSVPDPTREGYNFNGWSTSSSASSGISSSTLGTYTSTGDATYYATWSKKQYQVDINILSPSGVQDYNSGTMTQTYGSRTHTGTNEGFMDILYGDSWTISNITPAPGMALESVYLDNGNGTLVNNGNGTWTFTMNKDSGGNVINIKMRYENYPIQYLSGYGTNSIVGNSNVTYGSSINLLGTQTRNGYIFTGWLCNKNSVVYGASASYSPGDYSDGETITFTAQWRSKKYNVYYNNGYGGTNESDGSIYYENGTYKLRDGPSRTGFTFTGWLCSVDNKVYGSGATYNIPHNLEDEADITFTAQWKENTYNLVYNNSLNGDTKTYKLKYTESHSIIDNPFDNPNYYFKGWATTKERAEAGTVDYVPNAQVKELKELEGETFNLYAVWVETWASKYNSDQYKPDGKGEKDNPYLIASEENLAWVASQNNSFNGQYFKQITNLDFSSHYWLPIGRQSDFGGIYNGNGFEITNITTPENVYDSIYVGLYGKTNGATIENLRITNATIYGNSNAGIVIGYASSNYDTVRYCVIEDSTVESSTNGMIIGNNYGEVSCCLVKSSNATSGLLGGNSQANCLYEINGTRSQTSSFDLTLWGKVGNELLPAGYSWAAGASSITQDDITAWLNKELGN